VVSNLAAFLGLSALVIAAPGQDTALTIRNTLAGGRRCGVATSLGVSSGLAFWTLATSAGLAALLVTSEPVFAALKVVGAAYLVILGAQALRNAIRPPRGRDGARVPPTRLAPPVAYRQGLVSNMGNPKIAVFFTSLLPQFAPHGSFAGLLALGLLFCGLTLVWLAGYAVAVAKAGAVLDQPPVRRALDAVTGTVLVALGLRLAREHH